MNTDSPDAQKSEEQTFLDILYGSIRDNHSDADLIAEGRKACDAFAQGQSVHQVMQMVDSDMNFDTSELHQFMGGLRGGLDCVPN